MKLTRRKALRLGFAGGSSLLLSQTSRNPALALSDETCQSHGQMDGGVGGPFLNLLSPQKIPRFQREFTSPPTVGPCAQ